VEESLEQGQRRDLLQNYQDESELDLEVVHKIEDRADFTITTILLQTKETHTDHQVLAEIPKNREAQVQLADHLEQLWSLTTTDFGETNRIQTFNDLLVWQVITQRNQLKAVDMVFRPRILQTDLIEFTLQAEEQEMHHMRKDLLGVAIV
jgi:hypothetical protein